MGNPFQEQLLKAGLVNKKQANKANREKHLNRKKNKEEVSSEISAKAKEEQVAQAKRNRELNQKREQEKQQREKKAQVRQLIEQNRLEQDDRGEPYHFVEDSKIRRIFATDEMIEQLSRGQLAIVTLAGRYEVVPAKVALQILERQKEVVVAFHKK
jgi:hypothetical protein